MSQSMRLQMPVIGLEAEFRVFIDDEEVIPETYWRSPSAFIERPLLQRTSKSLQLPSGGALYFDGGVLEVVTPVIEIAPQCTARVVRSLWEQIAFVRDELDAWEKRTGHRARLQAFSCHVNISFELSREERNRKRTIQKLAVLLVRLLPVPIIVLAANRKSTGIGVRPRRDRIEITLDFTPDPGLMAAATALIVGVTRDIIEWDSYLLRDLEASGVPLLEGLEPGPHATRNGWVAKDFHFPKNPFVADVDTAEWRVSDGRVMSLRQIALDVATHFRDSIRRFADPFSTRLLFSVLRGETPSLLDLDDRPAEYDDVGRATRWGSVLPDLANFDAITRDRRSHARRYRDRRTPAEPVAKQRLTRSAYERVFLKLGARKRIRMNGQSLTPVKVRGWYESLFRAPNGEDHFFSIDQLLQHIDWFEE